MPHVTTSPCIGTHDTACMKVCPVNCFYDVPASDIGASGEGNILIIHPGECIDCTRCVPECPVSAIFQDDEVPEQDKAFIEMNKNWFVDKDQAILDAARCEP